ncbi:MAG: nucleotide-binding domain containing protein, partial [Chloroflexota bacterium]
VLIAPAFMAGGRVTIDGVHYVTEGNNLIPVAQTPFAADKTFGFAASDLRTWVTEKTDHRVAESDVHSISLTDIRVGGVDTVTAKLEALSEHAYCTIDAVTERDIEVVVLSALKAESTGKRFLYRTAASFAALRAGITLRPLLTPSDLQAPRTGGGLIVFGSYVPKSSSQLDYLLTKTDIQSVEVFVPALLSEETRAKEIERVVGIAGLILSEWGNVVVYTSRELITGENGDASLKVGHVVSASLVSITKRLQSRARFIIAKGGITSSDIATKALRCKRARVMGQVLPGVPVWELDASSAEPDMIYVVFPGNVGGVSSVADAIASFAQEET